MNWKYLKNVDRLMVRYLEKRGWTVFWLEAEHTCVEDFCWLKFYRQNRLYAFSKIQADHSKAQKNVEA